MAARPVEESSPPGAGAVPSSTGLASRGGPRRGLKIADRYLFSYVAEGTLRGLGWFAGLLLAFAIITAVRKAVEHTLPLGVMLQLIAYQMPRILLFTIPMSLLFGTVQAFSDLSSRGEITALGVGGMSLPRMVYPVLLWAFLLTVCAFVLQEAVVPTAEQRRTEVLAEGAAATVSDEPLRLQEDLPGGEERQIWARRFDPATRTLWQPRIHLLNADHQVYQKIVAEKAEWNLQTGQWRLYKGSSTTLPVQGGGNRRPLSVSGSFAELVVQLPPPSALGTARSGRAEHLRRANFEMVSWLDLEQHRRQLMQEAPSDRRNRQIRAATFGLHDKIATPLICLALVLVGAPLAVRPQRSSGGFSMGISLSVLLVYYVLWTWASQIGKAGVGHPLVLAYLSLALTTAVGLGLLWRKSR